jgi:hypothetical protein
VPVAAPPEQEVGETFLRCVKERFAETNAVIELNGLKIAEDRTFADCARYIFTAMLQVRRRSHMTYGKQGASSCMVPQQVAETLCEWQAREACQNVVYTCYAQDTVLLPPFVTPVACMSIVSDP